ncbi:MAG: hypothetical protein QOD56_2723 [Gammaproteobacteria bacterium]|nr:hypothetical protein [Gammaproteobacteria bacterium]
MEATAAPTAVLIRPNHSFYLWMAVGFVLVAFGGFTPTYFVRVAQGTFDRPPIIHTHGIIFFTWTLFYLAQTALAATGRIADHRAWGMAGISLFTIMLCTVIVGEITVLRLDDAAGHGDSARRFSAVTICGLPLMAGLFGSAIANVRRPELHKRFMILLMAACMTPAIARVFLTFLAPAGAAGAGPPPPFVSLPPAFLADMFIVAAMVYDWRTRGRPHPVYVYGGLAVLAQQALTVPFAGTKIWMTIAIAIEGLAG